MKRKRGFTVAETLTAGASTVIVGGLAISAFLATSSASSLANSRNKASRAMYQLSISLRKDVEQAESFELVSSTNLKLTTKDLTTGVESLTEYKLDNNSPPKVQRIVDGVVDPLLSTKVQSISINKVSDGCINYQLKLASASAEQDICYQGEVRLRNWIKK